MKAFEKTKAGPKLQKLKFRNHEFFYLPVIFLCKGRTIFEPTWARSPKKLQTTLRQFFYLFCNDIVFSVAVA